MQMFKTKGPRSGYCSNGWQSKQYGHQTWESGSLFLSLGHLIFEHCFEFRYSDFEFILRVAYTPVLRVEHRSFQALEIGQLV
jgi:hypothetical protein